MSDPNRPVIITGNWKMYKTITEATTYIQELIPLVKDATSKVYLAVPFTAIQEVAKAANGTNIFVGAQNMNDASEGAFTGEIAGKMLKEAGAQFVLLGHSERRRYFNESNAFINRKIKRALLDGLQPTLCIGESYEQRADNQTAEILEEQLTKGLDGLKEDDVAKLVIAYEPIWAVGTGEPATPEIAEEMHAFCREIISREWGKVIADGLVIQYGGSVNPENAKALLKQPNVDGLLVGGAALDAQTFSKIVNDM